MADNHVLGPSAPVRMDGPAIRQLLREPPCGRCQGSIRAHRKFPGSLIACTEYVPVTVAQLNEFVLGLDGMLERYHQYMATRDVRRQMDRVHPLQDEGRYLMERYRVKR